MKLTKKLMAVLLAALMIVTVIPFAFAATFTGTLENGVLTVSGSGAMGSFSEGAPWAEFANDTTSIVISDGITSVGAYAFKNFKKATSVTLPASVKDIDAYAFLNCASLQSIVLPAEMTAVKTGTFSGCTSLDGVIIPENVAEIQSYAFNHTGLTEIVLPAAVTSVAKFAFTNCDSLKKITIKNNKCSIVSGAFPPPTPSTSGEAPITFYAAYRSNGYNFAVANQYAYEVIPDEDKVDYGTPDTVQEVITVSEQTLKETKFGAFIRRLLELLGIEKKEQAPETENGTGSGSGSGGAESENNSTMTITGPGAEIGKFLMKTSFADVILSLREALQGLLPSLKI